MADEARWKIPYLDLGSSLKLNTGDSQASYSLRRRHSAEQPERGSSESNSGQRISLSNSQNAPISMLYSDDDTQLRSSGEADARSLPSDFSEGRKIPKRNLGSIQITCLMINLAIGSGILTTPAHVLALTDSKFVAILLWVAGGVYNGCWSVAGML